MASLFQRDSLSSADPFPDILGQNSIKRQLSSALLVGRHVVIVGPPGVGKTTLAKNVAKLLPSIKVNDCPYHCNPKHPICPACSSDTAGMIKTKLIDGLNRFVRIQGSPDLTVEDLLGDIDPAKAFQFGPFSRQAFTPGKIFRANNGVLFFDELNRCPEKLQNALLQVLEEGKATIGSYDIDLDANFIFIATMNPDDATTERLSDVLLDRFDVIRMSYPEDAATEAAIVTSQAPVHGLEAEFPEQLLHLTVYFVRLLRESDKVERKPGVRATIGLYQRAQALAALLGKKCVSWDDVAAVAPSVLAYRMTLKPSVQYLQSPEEFVQDELKRFAQLNRIELPAQETGDGP